MSIHRLTIVDHAHIVGTTFVDAELLATRRNIGMTWQDTVAAHRFLHRDLAQAIEPGCKAGGKSGGHVLGDHHARRIGRHAHEHLFDGLRAASRSANGHQLFRRNPTKGGLSTRRPCSSGLLGWRRCCGCSNASNMRRRGDPNLLYDLPRQILDAIDQANARFGNKVHRPQLQGAHGHLGTAFSKGGYHDDRHGAKTH